MPMSKGLSKPVAAMVMIVAGSTTSPPSEEVMSSENRVKSRRWFEEAWNERNTATIDELLCPDCLGHMESGDVAGAEAFKQVREQFLAAFPDLRFELENIVAEGDDVVIRWRATGTHDGDGFGHEPTGQPIAVRGITWHRFQGGKMVEGWDAWNQNALLQQLSEGPGSRRDRTQTARNELAGRLKSVREELYGEHGGPELARLLEIPARDLYNYETGVTIPGEVLLRIIELTGVRPAWLLRGEEPRYESGKRPPIPV